MRTLAGLLFIFVFLISGTSCSPEPSVKNGNDTTPKKPSVPRVQAPAFNPDSAYAFIEKQVSFGPRVPGTPGHAACASWLSAKLQSYGLSVNVQEAPVSFWDGRSARIKNIMGSYKPERTQRILFLAHWDTRPIADRDTARVKEPIDGANDGASGVGVLLELARVLQENDPNIGVDILFVDAEDYGQPNGDPETWCLGSQYWAQNIPAGYARSVKYGILLDMVGARGAVFPREGTSQYYASAIVEKVWSAAAALGYGNTFVNNVTGETTDDHLFVNEYARIPTIDIVHYDPATHDYGSFHHRHTDNMEIIDRNTLSIVGHVILDVLYNESPSQQP